METNVVPLAQRAARTSAATKCFGALLIALALLAGFNSSPPLQSTQAIDGLEPFALEPGATAEVGIESAGSPGHIDQTGFLRFPDGFPYKQPSDHIVFETDVAGAPAIRVSGADVGDRWTFKWFTPTQSPGTDPPDSVCDVEFTPADHPANPTGQIALIAFCSGQTQVLSSHGGACPCATNFFTVLLLIKGWNPDLGTWTLVVDFTDSTGAPAPAVHSAPMYITRTPAVLLIHGYNDTCAAFRDIDDLIFQELALPGPAPGQKLSRVRCMGADFETSAWGGYDSRKGVDPAAIKTAIELRKFRDELDLPADAEVDLVGHSLGGLVARFYYEHRYGTPDGPIGSISMLGAPNDGVQLARWEKFLSGACVSLFGIASAACGIVDWVDLEDDLIDIDLDSDGVDDLKPGSEILKRLADGFVIPERPLYVSILVMTAPHSVVLCLPQVTTIVS
jgi:pimeloyl-ACP methyl ester carboxylesterase